MVVVRAEYGCLLPALPTRAVTQYRSARNNLVESIWSPQSTVLHSHMLYG